MISHYVETHDVSVEEKHLEFGDFSKFLTWKEGVEQLEVCQFSDRCGPKDLPEVVTRYFRCSRDGFFKKKGKGLRHLKVKGSIKINGVCPASIKTSKSKATGVISVTYIHTHVGHSQELGRLNLSKTERAEIARKLAMGIPYKTILDCVRESMKTGRVRRFNLTTRKDIWNVQSSFHLRQTERGFIHGNDRTSVEAWVNLMKEESDVVRLYKPQGTRSPDIPELLENDMVLIIATEAQLEMLQKYGSNIICFDGTHGLNSYNFELTTILVLNDVGQGFPCAYMFSNRADSMIMTVFTKIICQSLRSPVKANVLMSDMSEIYMNGWSSIMPEPSNFLFCSWHVDNAWRKISNF